MASSSQTGAPVLINVTVTGNTALYGAGVLTSDGSGLQCIGCVLTGNAADQYGGGFLGGGALNTPTFINSVIANNTANKDVRAVAPAC